MASFTEKISVLIDVTVDRANKGIKDFRTAVSEAEGATGKLKAGASAAFDSVKANAGNLAIAGGAALVAFGVKAVAAFTESAKAALDLGTATGLSVEDASRWIAVGDDMGVTAESLTSGIGKIAKSLDDTKWEKFGVATRDASGEARNANDILLDTFDMLGKITNETERARIGNELFGRGYASLAPLVGKSRTEYERMLGAVEDGQVITEKEAKKAEKMRLAQDALSDALGEVTLAFGSLASETAPAIEGLAGMVTWTSELIGKLQDLDSVTGGGSDGGFGPFSNIFKVTKSMWDKGPGSIPSWFKDDVEGMTGSLSPFLDEIDRGGDMLTGFGTVMRGVSKDVRDDTDALDDARRATADLKAATDSLLGTLDQQDAWDRYAEALWRANDGVDTSERETRDLIRAQVDLINTMDDIPDEQKVALITQLEQGDVDTVNAWLTQWAKGVNVPVRFKGQGDVGFMKNATGTSFNPGGPTLVHKDEIINMPRGASVVPAGRAQQMRQRGLGGGAQIGTLIVQTNDQPRRWFDEALWRVAG